MLNRIILSRILIGLILVFAALPARAQESCDVNFEMITALFEPGFGSYSVWEAVLGEGPRQEVFKSVVDMGAGVSIAAGEMTPLPGVGPVIMLAGFDKRGRVEWEKYHNVSAVSDVVKMLKSNDRLVLLVNRDHKGEGKTVWIGFFDEMGVFKDQRVIREKGRDLVSKDMAFSPDGKRIIVAISEERKGGTAEKPIVTHFPEVHVLDMKGKDIIKRAYVMGADSEILGVSAGLYGEEKGEAIFVTGYVDYEGGKKSGWVMRLGPDAAMVWQQPFSRGLHSQIKRSAAFARDYILTFGDALPSDGGNVGSWLMLLDASSGQVMWQRFYNGGYHYFAADLAVHPQGLITLMMQAQAPGEKDSNVPKVPLMEDDGTIIGKMDYVHTLLLDPRGVTLSGESYFKGFGARAYQIVASEDRNRTLIAGSAETPYVEIYQKFAGMNDDGVMAPNGGEAGVLTKAGLPGAEMTVGALSTGEAEKPANLPEAALPEKSLSGLALLNKKVSESVANKDEAVAEPGVEDAPKTTLDGWVFAGNGPEDYKDPCIKREVTLP